MPGPVPASLMVKIPKLPATTVIGAGALVWPRYVTVTVPVPAGTVEGRMAVSALSQPPLLLPLFQTQIRIAFVVVLPTVTETVTPSRPFAVGSGNDEAFTGAAVVGAKLLPNSVNIDPCAMEAFGSPASA